MFPFTDPQKEAVESNKINLRIIACAGSGKTSTIAGKVAYLLNPKNGLNVLPKNIIAFTYTDKAAAELKNKILKFIKEDEDLKEIKGIADMYIGTIHGWCLKALQETEYKYQKYSVLNDIKLRLFVDKNYSKIGMTDITKNGTPPGPPMKIFVDTGRFIQVMNIIRESKLTGPLPANIREAKEKYEATLQNNCYFDFTMIMTEAIERLNDKKELYNKIKRDLKYLIVDEYQDINPIQENLIEKLYETAKPILTVVGDDDQNIYQWRGSNNQFIKDFLNKYSPATEKKLEDNFRSSKGITSLAETIISRNSRLPKTMNSAQKQTFVKNEDLLFNTFTTIDEENDFIAKTIKNLYSTSFKVGHEERGLDYSDFAILLRTWSKTEKIVQKLSEYDIPYITAGVNQLFSVTEVKAATAIFQFLYKEITDDELKTIWLSIPHNSISEEKLNEAVLNLEKYYPENHVDGKGKPVWAYSLQAIYWDFLEDAEITEERFNHDVQSEIVMYNLGKFSQVINDFEEINFNSSLPSFHLFNFLNFLQYAAKDYYPEGWLNNPYKTPRAVQIMTIHQAKGLEFPVVFIPGLNKNYLPAKKPGGLTEWHFLSPSLIENQRRYVGDIEDERRLFYVALTRAQKYLFVSRAPDANNQLYRKPSDFVDELSRSDEIVSNIPDFENHTRIIPEPKGEVISITLNFSVLKDFFECQYRFKLASMYGFSYPLNQRMGFGRSLHNSLMEIHKRSKLGEKLDKTKAEEIAENQSHFPYLGKSILLEEMKEIVKNRVIEYYQKNEPSLAQIEFVEQEIQLNLDEGILVTGKIDLIKRKLYEEKYETTIIEFKSTGDAQKQKTTELQLNLYALGHKELTGEKADYIQIYDLENNHELIRKVLSEGHLDETRKKITEAAEIIRSQIFVRVNNKPVCKDCLLYQMCSSGIKFNKKQSR